MEQHDCDESPTLLEIHAERSQKHVVLQSTATLQLKRFTFGSEMAIAASAPLLPNQKKQCRKIARFTDAPCTSAALT